MQASWGISQSFAFILLAGFVMMYGWGWRRLRRAMPALATRLRLVAFGIAMLSLTAALVWPLPGWSNYLLVMRSLQTVAICMIGVPMLWLAAPVHVIVWGIHGGARRMFVSLHRQKWLHYLTQPLVTWFFYVSAFLFWHDPSVAQYLLGPQIAHTAAPWLLFSAALLFWWPVVNTGPRIYRDFPAWLVIFYVLCVEVANMVTGMNMAFSAEPLYPYYPAMRAQLPLDALPWSQGTDQMAGGAIIWVFGSLVYVSSIVCVLSSLFRKEGSTTPQHPLNWDDDAKFIAPGLEHRVAQNYLRKVDLNHH
jgi:cytochrome c oxidase assembly factor CtaG